MNSTVPDVPGAGLVVEPSALDAAAVGDPVVDDPVLDVLEVDEHPAASAAASSTTNHTRRVDTRPSRKLHERNMTGTLPGTPTVPQVWSCLHRNLPDDLRTLAVMASPIRLRRPAALAVATVLVALSACGDRSSTSSSTPAAATASGATDTTAGVKLASWGSDVTISYGDGTFSFVSNGIPNHARQAEYALPNQGVMVPGPTTAYAGADPTKAQLYNYKITTRPVKAAKTTSTSLGVIGVMISGATLFNPYEGDAKTVATASNFTVKNAAGQDVAFLDGCNGHPTPMGQYHYHALPSCVTATVDTAAGPSHLIGVAFDGFPIYGDRDADGNKVTAAQLDACNGITSPTPEFPQGIYHYVLLNTPDSTSSIRCFGGTVDASLTSMGGMPGMPPMPGMRPTGG